jgi:hypothetical protein
MSLVETCTLPELAAHYKAVRARLWTPRPRPHYPEPVKLFYYQTPPQAPIEPPAPEPDRSVEGIAARWRDVDERLFGGRVSPRAAIYVTAAYFGLSVEAVCSNSRYPNILKARQTAIYIAHTLCLQVRSRGKTVELLKFSFPQLAKHFRVDHSTCYHSIDRVRSRMAEDEKYATAISDITALLQRGEKK